MMKDDVGPNSTAAALRRLADFSSSRHLSVENRTLAQEKAAILIQDIDRAVDDNSIDLNLHSLADILTALGMFDKENNKRLANRVCKLMDDYEDELVKTLKPYRLLECLKALASLELYHSSLIGRISHRLQQGDALAMLEARHLAGGIKALVMLGRIHDNEGILRTFMRRWRKQAFRQTATTADICQTLYAARCLLRHTGNNNENLVAETTTVIYTLLRELHGPSLNATASRSLTAGQVAETLMTVTAFQVKVENSIFGHLMRTLGQDRTLECATIPDIARILLSMERLGLYGYHSVVQSLGRQFLDLVQNEAVEPRSVCTILRAALRLHARDDEVMESYVKAARFLLVDDTNGNEAPFLQSCSDVHLGSLVRFLSIVRCDDEKALVALAERILEPDMIEYCSAEAASRILTYFTALIDSSIKEMFEMRSLLSDMYHELGTHLLTAQLSPAGTSAAMQAYAKASYVRDMGIFDHLASHLVTTLDDCSVRQVTQGLWACGKMMVWESEHVEAQQSWPPYLEAAKKYATFLASRAAKLTAKDVSQALWATGRLRIDNVKVVCAFAYRARQVASDCTSQEVANVLWGLSRVGFDDRAVVSVLTNRMSELYPSAQEAATVLYALGRMEIKDEQVFSSMSDVMMKQLETASAQAIANALWAYRTVHIAPPRELMDSWVIQKLGLDSVPAPRLENL